MLGSQRLEQTRAGQRGSGRIIDKGLRIHGPLNQIKEFGSKAVGSN